MLFSTSRHCFRIANQASDTVCDDVREIGAEGIGPDLRRPHRWRFGGLFVALIATAVACDDKSSAPKDVAARAGTAQTREGGKDKTKAKTNEKAESKASAKPYIGGGSARGGAIFGDQGSGNLFASSAPTPTPAPAVRGQAIQPTDGVDYRQAQAQAKAKAKAAKEAARAARAAERAAKKAKKRAAKLAAKNRSRSGGWSTGAKVATASAPKPAEAPKTRGGGWTRHSKRKAPQPIVATATPPTPPPRTVPQPAKPVASEQPASKRGSWSLAAKAPQAAERATPATPKPAPIARRQGSSAKAKPVVASRSTAQPKPATKPAPRSAKAKPAPAKQPAGRLAKAKTSKRPARLAHRSAVKPTPTAPTPSHAVGSPGSSASPVATPPPRVPPRVTAVPAGLPGEKATRLAAAAYSDPIATKRIVPPTVPSPPRAAVPAPATLAQRICPDNAGAGECPSPGKVVTLAQGPGQAVAAQPCIPADPAPLDSIPSEPAPLEP